MTQLLFRNRWFALIWAMLLCFSVWTFFGEDGGQQQLAQAAQDIKASRVAAARAESEAQQEFEESQAIRVTSPVSEGSGTMLDAPPMQSTSEVVSESQTEG